MMALKQQITQKACQIPLPVVLHLFKTKIALQLGPEMATWLSTVRLLLEKHLHHIHVYKANTSNKLLLHISDYTNKKPVIKISIEPTLM